jgi:RNA polymerase sigma factor (sigma-70 family)
MWGGIFYWRQNLRRILARKCDMLMKGVTTMSLSYRECAGQDSGDETLRTWDIAGIDTDKIANNPRSSVKPSASSMPLHARNASHAALVANLDDLLSASRPQLLGVARAMGNPPDAAEDIVQETLLEALRHLDRIYSLDRFDAWLKEICRNVCRRHAQAMGTRRRHLVDIADWSTEDDLPGMVADDPIETLDRSDLAQVLDRALGYLPAQTRTAMELCYVEDLPQREVAAQLGLTIKALESRLIRARQQLRAVLSGAMREEAEAFDLLPTGEPSLGWRESREWCTACGRQRLRGIFEQMPDGRINFRMRCPSCSPNYDTDMNDSGGLIPLDDLHTFRPALKRLNQTMIPYIREGLSPQGHRCMQCGRQVRVQIEHSDEMPLRVQQQQYYAIEQCRCPERSRLSTFAAAGVARYGHPVIDQFIAEHPRWVREPSVLTEFQGQPAFRFAMVDLSGAARCTYFADTQMLDVLAVFVE